VSLALSVCNRQSCTFQVRTASSLRARSSHFDGWCWRSPFVSFATSPVKGIVRSGVASEHNRQRCETTTRFSFFIHLYHLQRCELVTLLFAVPRGSLLSAAPRNFKIIVDIIRDNSIRPILSFMFPHSFIVTTSLELSLCRRGPSFCVTTVFQKFAHVRWNSAQRTHVLSVEFLFCLVFVRP
jgi:hypothetical protein